jgi:hypothetical protein
LCSGASFIGLVVAAPLRVEAVGNNSCYYGGAKKINATDDAFKDTGKVNLWTKAGSLTYFDELQITAK